MSELPPGLAQLRTKIVHSKVKQESQAKVDVEKRSASKSPSGQSPAERDASPVRAPQKRAKSLRPIETNPSKWELSENKTSYVVFSRRLKRYISAPTTAKRKISSGKKSSKRAPKIIRFQLKTFYPRCPGFSEHEKEVLEIRDAKTEKVIQKIDLTQCNLRSDPEWQVKEDDENETVNDSGKKHGPAEERLVDFVKDLNEWTAKLSVDEGNWQAEVDIQPHPTKEDSYSITMSSLVLKLVRVSKKQHLREAKHREKVQKELAELKADLDYGSFKPAEGRRTRRSTMDTQTYNLIVGKIKAEDSDEEASVPDSDDEE